MNPISAIKRYTKLFGKVLKDFLTVKCEEKNNAAIKSPR